MSKLPDHSFTSKAPNTVPYQRCARPACNALYGLEVTFEFVSGPPGQAERLVCPPCATYYRRKRGEEAGQTSVPAQQRGVLLLLSSERMTNISWTDFTHIVDQQLIAANTASRRGGSQSRSRPHAGQRST